jgi:radical SAM superfamily enzyme YgiQ (UPF0313 family)
MSENGKSVVLVRPPVVSSKSSFSAPVTPPLALAYLAGTLRKEGYDVTGIDAIGLDIESFRIVDDIYAIRGLDVEEIVKRIPEDPDLIAVSCSFSVEWLFVKALMDKINEKFPNVPLVAGGEHITALSEEVLIECPYVKACAIGEGEAVMLDMAKHFIDGDRSLESVLGIAFMTQEGKYLRTPSRPRITQLEEIPWPAWDLFPIEAYLSGGYGHGTNQGRTMPMLATRGCPYTCTFCSNDNMWTTRYVTRSPKDVVNEMEHYIEKYGAVHFDFYDLTAIVKKSWFVEFGQEVLDRKLNVSYSLPSGTRSEALDEEATALMAKTNCKYLVYAAESGSKRILKEIKKKIDLDKMIESIRGAKKNGLETRCNLMLGFPTETRRDVLDTIKFQIRLAMVGVDDAPLYMFSPYPGSELFRNLRESGSIKALDVEYYKGLICQMDLMEGNRVPTLLSKNELVFWRIVGMSLFYSMSYLFFPSRILRSYRNIFKTRVTDTVFEQRIVELLRRKGFLKNPA